MAIVVVARCWMAIVVVTRLLGGHVVGWPYYLWPGCWVAILFVAKCCVSIIVGTSAVKFNG